MVVLQYHLPYLQCERFHGLTVYQGSPIDCAAKIPTVVPTSTSAPRERIVAITINTNTTLGLTASTERTKTLDTAELKQAFVTASRETTSPCFNNNSPDTGSLTCFS